MRFHRACVAGLIVSSLAALYVSLVPFDVSGEFDPERISLALQWPAIAAQFSRTDFLANALLFIPIGFFGLGAFVDERETAMARTVSVVSVVAGAAMLSVVIEGLQLFAPERSPSVSDIAAQMLGAGGGATVSLLLLEEIRRWWEHGPSATRWSGWRLWLALYAIARAAAMLLPFDVTVDLGDLARKYRDGLIVLDPSRSAALTAEYLPYLFSDLVLAAPVGALACLVATKDRRLRGLVAAAGLVIAFFSIVEAAQVFVISRAADVADLAVNAAGGLAGVLITAAVLPASVATTRSGWRERLPIAGLTLSIALYIAHHWAPFDFQLSPDLIRERIGALAAVPFSGYYQNPEFKALSDAIVKILVSAPIGLFAQWSLRAVTMSYRRIVATAVLLAGAAFFGIVEAGQVLLPSRYPDTSDILLALFGASVGWAARSMQGHIHREGRQAREVDPG